MSYSLLISGGTIVNEGQLFVGYILVVNGLIAEVGAGEYIGDFHGTRIAAAGKIVMPGVIDCHVHFREPGLTHKGDMSSESAAAIAGGVTSVLEMPNTVPPATTQDALDRKFDLAEGRMHTNYSFFPGATNDNLDDIRRLNLREVCGVKLFMGSSTGNMLLDSDRAISALFAEFGGVISAHCEDEAIIRADTDLYHRCEGENATARIHQFVRSAEACYRSSAHAVELADRYGARLHVAHLTTTRELSLFDTKPLTDKRITAEACIPHLWFTDSDYVRLGNLIKCNPAIKTAEDRDALRTALTGGKLDVVATDHAPHTREEKSRRYWEAPSGTPMVQHSLAAMIELVADGVLSLETLVERMCHAPATLFGIAGRGFLRPGFKADIVIVDPAAEWTVAPENILYKCGWSPLESVKFGAKVACTIIDGQVVYDGNDIVSDATGERLKFE